MLQPHTKTAPVRTAILVEGLTTKDRAVAKCDGLGPVLVGACTTRVSRRRWHRRIQAGLADRLHQQHGPGLRDRATTATLSRDTWVQPDTLVHLASASFLATNGTLDKPYRCRSGALLAFMIKPRTTHLVKARG